MLAKGCKYAWSGCTLRFVHYIPLVFFASLLRAEVFLGQEPTNSDLAYVGMGVFRDLPYLGSSGYRVRSLDRPHLFPPSLNLWGGVSR